MSTRRRLVDSPAPWAEPILTLLELTRTAATPADVDPAPWAAAEAGQTRIHTGYRAARRTASAGQYAARVLRLRAAADVAAGDTRPWVRALAAAGPHITTWDWDTRMRGALDLRATTNDLPHLERTDALPARLVAAWLTHNHGPRLVPATGRLCAYVLEHPDADVTDLAAAWDATHAHRLHRATRAA